MRITEPAISSTSGATLAGSMAAPMRASRNMPITARRESRQICVARSSSSASDTRCTAGSGDGSMDGAGPVDWMAAKGSATVCTSSRSMRSRWIRA